MKYLKLILASALFLIGTATATFAQKGHVGMEKMERHQKFDHHGPKAKNHQRFKKDFHGEKRKMRRHKGMKKHHRKHMRMKRLYR
jgi:hypothetical protein